MAIGNVSFESLDITRRNASEVAVTWSCPDMISTTSSKRRLSELTLTTRRNYSCTVNQFKCALERPCKKMKQKLDPVQQIKLETCDKFREFNKEPYKMRDTIVSDLVGLIRCLYKLVKETLFFVGCYPCSDIYGALKNFCFQLKCLMQTIVAIVYRIRYKMKTGKGNIFKCNNKKK